MARRTLSNTHALTYTLVRAYTRNQYAFRIYSSFFVSYSNSYATQLLKKFNRTQNKIKCTILIWLILPTELPPSQTPVFFRVNVSNHFIFTCLLSSNCQTKNKKQ